MTFKQWNNFSEGKWTQEIDVRDFIIKNYSEYTGDENFLQKSTERTNLLMKELNELFEQEKKSAGVLDIDVDTVASLTHFGPGYLDKENEIIVGLQTDKPLKRAVNPFGGLRMTRDACREYGYELSEKVEKEFTFRTTHNDGVFRAYTDEMKAARSSGIITGLPDAYGRGRIIGDYRRVALYGVDRLIAAKEEDKKA